MITRLRPADSLRTRILLTTSGTITLIMMVISWGILAQWRQTLLAKEQQHAIAVTRAFSVTVTEAMMFERNDLAQSEGELGGLEAEDRLLHRSESITGAGRAANSLRGRGLN